MPSRFLILGFYLYYTQKILKNQLFRKNFLRKEQNATRNNEKVEYYGRI